MIILPAPTVINKGIKSNFPAFPVTTIKNRIPYALINNLYLLSLTSYLSANLKLKPDAEDEVRNFKSYLSNENLGTQ